MKPGYFLPVTIGMIAGCSEYHLGTEIKNLIDTVHFTESHLSRLLQLADIHIWCRQFRSLDGNSENDAEGDPELW